MSPVLQWIETLTLMGGLGLLAGLLCQVWITSTLETSRVCVRCCGPARRSARRAERRGQRLVRDRLPPRKAWVQVA